MSTTNETVGCSRSEARIAKAMSAVGIAVPRSSVPQRRGYPFWFASSRRGKSSSDWDILCVGNGVSRMTGGLDLVWLGPFRDWTPYDGLVRNWRDMLHGTVFGSRACPRGAILSLCPIAHLIRKASLVLARMAELKRHWPHFSRCYRLKYLTRIRRDLQRFDILLDRGTVPPTRTLDQVWRKTSDHLAELSRIVGRSDIFPRSLPEQLAVAYSATHGRGACLATWIKPYTLAVTFLVPISIAHEHPTLRPRRRTRRICRRVSCRRSRACKSRWSIWNRASAASACCAAASRRRPCCTWPRRWPKPSTSPTGASRFAQPTIDVAAVRARKEKVIATLTGGLKQLAAKRKVNVVRARAAFEDSQTLKLDSVDGTPLADDRIVFEHCIVATGSSPTRIPAFDLPTHRVMDSTGALELPDVPESLLVVGGGYIGLEMGTVYAALGKQGLGGRNDRRPAARRRPRPGPAAAKATPRHLRGDLSEREGRRAGRQAGLDRGDVRGRRAGESPAIQPRAAVRRPAAEHAPAWGWKRPAFRSTAAGSSRSIGNAARPIRAFWPSATWPASRCWPTRRPTKARSPSR